MDVSEFLHYYGVKRFVRDWPFLKNTLPANIARKAGVHDLAWSKLSGGGWNLRPFPDFNSMPKRRRQFLVAVAKKPGMSVNEVAETLGIECERARAHAANLILERKIRVKQVVEGGSLKTKLFPTYDV